MISALDDDLYACPAWVRRPFMRRYSAPEKACAIRTSSSSSSQSVPLLLLPVFIFTKQPVLFKIILFRSSRCPEFEARIFTLIFRESSLTSSASRGFRGKAIVISFHPSEAKCFAIITEDVVIELTPSSRNHSPIVSDWWVLKWGLKFTFDALAFEAMNAMFFLHFISSRRRVGLLILSRIVILLFSSGQYSHHIFLSP